MATLPHHKTDAMQLVVTGADGFIAKNLRLRLLEAGYSNVFAVTRSTSDRELVEALAGADFVYHLAGVNRPTEVAEFAQGNAVFSERIAGALAAAGRRTPVAFTSSIQAVLDNPYGQSKLAAEQALVRYGEATGAAVYLLRLPNVFGKWCRPNYNSVVATFCHNVANGLPITINNPDAALALVYVDDVVTRLIGLLTGSVAPGFVEVDPRYETTVGALADQIKAFTNCRSSLLIERVGGGLPRALYATYVSYLPPAQFAYALPQYADPRGVFVEMLKTPDAGQFSYFTAHAGVTRGGHYHHTKTEKFLVIRGRARFRFRQMLSGEYHEHIVDGSHPEIVETIPGWAHDITNIGDEEMIVMLWANENFDRARPDTIAKALQ